jgi:Arc-like DNA binding domain
MVRKSQELRPLMTRIPEGLRRKLEREAEQNRRSMNAEIIHRLTQSFVRQETTDLIDATVKRTLEAQAQTPLTLRAAAQRQSTEPKPANETDKPNQGE